MSNKRKLIDSFKEETRFLIYQFLYEGEKEALSKTYSKEQITAIFELLNDFALVMDDQEASQRLKQFANKHMYTYITENLRHKRWNIRLNALYMIENFQMDHLQTELEAHFTYKKLTQLEETQLLKLYAMFHYETIIDKVLHTKHSLSNFELLSIFAQMNKTTFTKLSDQFQTLPFPYQLAILDTIANKNCHEFAPLIRQLLEVNEIELKIRSLKVYAETDISAENIDLIPFLYHDVWQLRLMATKIVGTKKLDYYKDATVDRLTDQEYIIRKEAAKALVQFPDGEELLREITKKSDDPFAVDMANEWLQKERVRNFY